MLKAMSVLDTMVKNLDKIGRALHGLELQMMMNVDHGHVDLSKILKARNSIITDTYSKRAIFEDNG